jgi:hypothetical protein
MSLSGFHGKARRWQVSGPRPHSEESFDDEKAKGTDIRKPTAMWRIVPALLSGPETCDQSPVAIVMMTGGINAAVHTGDARPGADPVNVAAARFLRCGFALVAALDHAALSDLPTPAGWRATLARDTRTLVIEEHGVTIYAGPIDIEIPPNWYRALFSRGSIALLIASDLQEHDRFMTSIDHARLAGNLLGATIPLAD